MAKQSSSSTTSGAANPQPQVEVGAIDLSKGFSITDNTLKLGAEPQVELPPLKQITAMVHYVLEGGPMSDLAHVIEAHITGSHTTGDEALTLVAQMQKLQLVGERASSIARDAYRARGK